jgi:hypothetical protein
LDGGVGDEVEVFAWQSRRKVSIGCALAFSGNDIQVNGPEPDFEPTAYV